jgi:prepilin-type N-terminal cleavage/methylation domain-containing protein
VSCAYSGSNFQVDMRQDHRPNRALTLIEVLVVIAIIGVLLAMVVPSLARGKFNARVRTCANNYRQLALAATMYAQDDSGGRLPNFALPTESSQLKTFQNLYPWLVDLQMLEAMEDHGVSKPQLWFCPLRSRWRDAHDTFRNVNGRSLESIADLVSYYRDIQEAKYAFLDLNWWVPRALEGFSTLTYPDPSLIPARLQTPWPTKMDDSSLSTRPIISDWMMGSKSSSADGIQKASGAHAVGGKVQNCNAAYGDGRVETRSANQIRWELRITEDENRYIFY